MTNEKTQNLVKAMDLLLEATRDDLDEGSNHIQEHWVENKKKQKALNIIDKHLKTTYL